MFCPKGLHARPPSFRVALTLFGPPRLDYAAQYLAPLLCANVPPPGRAEPDGGPLYRWRREFSARNIKEFQREIEQDLRWKTRVAGDGSKSGTPASTERPR